VQAPKSLTLLRAPKPASSLKNLKQEIIA